jgi:hypothetical protein
MAAIRRLDDASGLDGMRGVYSLTSLLNDIIEHSDLLTRKQIFDAEKIEYDYAVIQAKQLEFRQKMRNAGQTSYMIPRDLQDNSHHFRHMQIDRLIGVAPSDRKPSDQIPKALLESLNTKICSSAERVKIYVDKFVAHAATPFSRAGLDEAGITLGHLWEAQRHMCEVASFVSHYLLGKSQPSFMPSPQSEPFRFIERPLIDESHIPKLKEVLDEFREECDKWGRWVPDGISGC